MKMHFFKAINFFKKKGLFRYKISGYYNIRYLGILTSILDYIRNILILKIIIKFSIYGVKQFWHFSLLGSLYNNLKIYLTKKKLIKGEKILSEDLTIYNYKELLYSSLYDPIFSFIVVVDSYYEDINVSKIKKNVDMMKLIRVLIFIYNLKQKKTEIYMNHLEDMLYIEDISWNKRLKWCE